MGFKWLKSFDGFKNTTYEEQNIIEKCTVYHIPCDRIRANSVRSRCDFDEDKLLLLAYSIRKYGILEPLCVRKTDAEDSYDYEIIFGERRLRAAKLLGLCSVPCIIIDVTDKISAEMSVAENVLRSNLNYFEVAVALKRITELGEESFEDIAQRLTMTQKELIGKIKLLDLDFKERQALIENEICEEIAIEIARIEDKDVRAKAIERIIKENLDTLDFKKALYQLCEEELPQNKNISRDVSSAISGIIKRVDFINRHRKKADMQIIDGGDSVYIRIDIKK